MKKISTLLLIILANYLFAQVSNSNQKVVAEINYFTYNYKYLDRDFKIKIPDSVFQQSIKKYKFKPDMVVGKRYQDSLGVVFADQFQGDWAKVNSGSFQIGYTTLRLSYHIWTNEIETKQLMQKYNFTHPYLFNQYIANEKNHDAYLKDFFVKLRTKVYNEIKDEKVKTASIPHLLYLAMYNSPERKKAFQSLVEQRTGNKK